MDRSGYLINLLAAGDVGIRVEAGEGVIHVEAWGGGEATLWRQDDGTWWVDCPEPHTPEPLHEALPWALRVCGVNKDDLP